MKLLFQLFYITKPIFVGFPVFYRILFYHHWNQHTQFAFPSGFGGDLILKSKENRLFSVFRLFAGFHFITIEISVVFYPYWPVFMSFEWSQVSITDILFLWNAKAQKPVKITEIGKSKIQVLIKVGYDLSALKFSDLKSHVFSSGLQCYI